MKIIRLLVIVAMAAVWSPLPAGADQTFTSFDFAVDGALCPQTGDIAGTGKVHVAVRSSADGNGVVHGGLDLNTSPRNQQRMPAAPSRKISLTGTWN